MPTPSMVPKAAQCRTPRYCPQPMGVLCSGVLLLLFIGVAASAGFAQRAAPTTSPAPELRFPVEPLGFVPQPRFFLPYRIPGATLDFLDASHILFTFHVARLMQREPDDPDTDLDQTIRAVVLHLPDGKVEAEGSWRLHDRERYLWTLPDGHFILRIRDTLYQSDKTLVLKTYLHPEGTFVTADFSPDRNTMAVQYSNPAPEDAGFGAAPPPSLGTGAPQLPSRPRRYTLLIVNNEERKADRAGVMPHAVVLPLMQGGYLGVEQGRGKFWSVELNSFAGDQRQIVQVESTCQPIVNVLSQQVFLTRSCVPFSSDRVADAYDLAGKKLWEQMWQTRFTWGTFAYTNEGNRFAYGSIEIDHNLADLDPVDSSSILGQPVGVFDVMTGKSDMVLDATPILSAGENFALSPDGDKLAILRNGAIEIFAMPPLAPAAAQPSAQAALNQKNGAHAH
jgi:hypothetical protein